MITLDEVLNRNKIFKNRDVFKKVMIDYANEIIDRCANNAEIEIASTYNRGGESEDYSVVDRNSILNLKKDIK